MNTKLVVLKVIFVLSVIIAIFGVINIGNAKTQDGATLIFLVGLIGVFGSVRMHKITKNKIAHDSVISKIKYDHKVADYLFVNSDKKELVFMQDKYVPAKIKFSDILSFEITEDGRTVTQGGLGSAIVGNALFGAKGAVVGGIVGKKTSSNTINRMTVIAHTKSITYPVIKINLLTRETKRGGLPHMKAEDNAHEIISVLEKIVSSKEPQVSNKNVESESCPTCGNELKESKTGEHLLCHTCRKKFRKELFQTEDDYEEYVH